MTLEKAITITVRLFGGLREISGTSSLSVRLRKESHLSDLAQRLPELLPSASDRLRAGLAQGYVHVLVDGRDADLIAGEDPLLSDGASVVLIPPIGGG